jgi:hypothetical protein
VVQIKNDIGDWRDITEMKAMESATMDSTRWKCTASFGTPFMTIPLATEFCYFGKGKAAEAVLSDAYEIPELADQYIKQFIKPLVSPGAIKDAVEYRKKLSLDTYRNY